MRPNLHKTWCLCNIIFLILTCFHLTYQFGEEKFSALPSKDKAAIFLLQENLSNVSRSKQQYDITNFRPCAALNETHLHLLYQTFRLLLCESLRVSFFHKILGPEYVTKTPILPNGFFEGMREYILHIFRAYVACQIVNFCKHFTVLKDVQEQKNVCKYWRSDKQRNIF